MLIENVFRIHYNPNFLLHNFKIINSKKSTKIMFLFLFLIPLKTLVV